MKRYIHFYRKRNWVINICRKCEVFSWRQHTDWLDDWAVKILELPQIVWNQKYDQFYYLHIHAHKVDQNENQLKVFKWVVTVIQRKFSFAYVKNKIRFYTVTPFLQVWKYWQVQGLSQDFGVYSKSTKRFFFFSWRIYRKIF